MTALAHKTLDDTVRRTEALDGTLSGVGAEGLTASGGLPFMLRGQSFRMESRSLSRFLLFSMLMLRGISSAPSRVD